MGSRIQCFMIEPTGRQRRSLRRFASQRYDSVVDGRAVYLAGEEERVKCPGRFSYHNASVLLDEVAADDSPIGDTWSHDDPRWPKACECGYVFADFDRWQLFRESLYRRPETDELVVLREAPVGAMWNATWFVDRGHFVGPDGRSLVVMTPGGEWNIDGPSNNGPGWTRSGEPPNVTASPSILIGTRYHGWLRNGWLEEC